MANLFYFILVKINGQVTVSSWAITILCILKSQLLYSTLFTTNNHKGYCSLNINSRLNGVNSAKPKEKIQTRWAKNRVRARDNENFNVYIQRTQVLSSSSSSSRLVPKGKLFSSFTLTWMHNLKFQIFNKKIIFCLFFVHQLIDPLPQNPKTLPTSSLSNVPIQTPLETFLKI